MEVYKSLLFVFFLIFVNVFFGQKPIDSTNFGSPLKIPLVLSGNFCEMRPNHFHTGLDIKTQGGIGKEVISIEEGYVSRIYYSHWGYGLAVYITHPNGYTSVYAHLSSFSKKIEKKVKEIQEQQESETFNEYLKPNEIVLKKGELIGLSGSSGSSYAPHLHFEIRDTKTELAMNPLLFGFNIKDTKNPDIKGVKLYPISDDAIINGEHKAVYISAKSTGNNSYSLRESVKAYGDIGIGIHTTDKLNAAGNVCGVYEVEMKVNNETIYGHQMKYMDFDKSRYINHHKDYDEYHINKKNIHKNFIVGNNELDIYKNLKNNGVLTVKTDSIYKVNYLVKDAYFNKSSLSFSISGEKKPEKSFKPNKTNCTRYFDYDKGVFFDTTNFTLLMAKGTIYNSHCFNYEAIRDSSYLADIHIVNSEEIPVHGYFQLLIKPRENWAKKYQDKLIVVELTDKGYQINREGTYVNGLVHTRVRAYGRYTLNIDTVSPYIQLQTNEKSLTSLKSSSRIDFKIGDNLSGLDTYKAYLNGKWILANYNRKRGTLSVNLSNGAPIKGDNKLKIELVDERGNTKSEVVEFTVK